MSNLLNRVTHSSLNVCSSFDSVNKSLISTEPEEKDDNSKALKAGKFSYNTRYASNLDTYHSLQ